MNTTMNNKPTPVQGQRIEWLAWVRPNLLAIALVAGVGSLLGGCITSTSPRAVKVSGGDADFSPKNIEKYDPPVYLDGPSRVTWASDNSDYSASPPIIFNFRARKGTTNVDIDGCYAGVGGSVIHEENSDLWQCKFVGQNTQEQDTELSIRPLVVAQPLLLNKTGYTMVVEDGSGNIIQQIAHDPEHPQSLASGAAKIYTEFGESLDPYIGLVWLDVMRQTVESEFAPVYPLPSPDIWRVIVVSAHTRSTLDTFTFRNFDIEYRKDPSSAWEDYFKSPAARGSFIPIQERGYVGDFRWYWQDPGLYYPCLNELPAEPDRPDSPICRITLDAEGIEFLKSLPETRNTSEREISLTPYYK